MLSLALASCAALLSGAAASPLSTGSLGGSRTLSLAGSTKAAGGSPWTVRNHNGTLVLPATVPGVVHLDLLRAKKITEPYYRYGATASRCEPQPRCVLSPRRCDLTAAAFRWAQGNWSWPGFTSSRAGPSPALSLRARSAPRPDACCCARRASTPLPP